MKKPDNKNSNYYLEDHDYLDQYDGLTIHTTPGLHEYLFKEMSQLYNKKSTILELGCGTGAFSQRLFRHGYTNLLSVDFNEKMFTSNSLKYKNINLNGTFYKKFTQKYDLIISIETIEHLENTYYFIKNCSKLLKRGGTLILTTPNIANSVSKAMFAIYSHFQWFIPQHLQKIGHTNPIYLQNLEHALLQNKLTIEKTQYFGDPINSLGNPHPMPRLWKSVLKLAEELRKITPPLNEGEILVLFTKKT